MGEQWAVIGCIRRAGAEQIAWLSTGAVFEIASRERGGTEVDFVLVPLRWDLCRRSNSDAMLVVNVPSGFVTGGGSANTMGLL